MSAIKYWLRGAIYLWQFVTGLVRYVLTRKTAHSAYIAMIMLFCRTGGHSNDFLSRIISLFRPPRPLPAQQGSLPSGADAEATQALAALRERGYYVFQNRLPNELCDQLLAFATQHPASTRLMDGDTGKVTRMVYDRENPQAVRYDFTTQDLVDNPTVQKVLGDLSFAGIAQQYLQSIPIVDVVGMWWHTNFSDRPDSEAAQFFHFDMDRPKWLKFFIYLTDVTTDNGPHFYVAGSHKTGGIAPGLLKKGYARLSDDEVKANYPASDIIEFTAPRGTILAEDTRGLHKGKHVIAGDRLMFQIQFSNSLFGGAYSPSKFPDQVVDELRESIRQYPDVYVAFR